MIKQIISINDGESCRLDLAVCRAVPGASRAQVRDAIKRNQVLVNGRQRAPGYNVIAGDRIELLTEFRPPRARPELAAAQGAALVPAGAPAPENARVVSVLYEDPYLMALHKPPAMHSVTLSADNPLTLADVTALRELSQTEASPDPREAGLVQRLDYFTEGVLLAARTRKIWEELHHRLVGSAIEKGYVALVEGEFPSGQVEIDAALVAGRERMRVQRNNAKALTASSVAQAAAILGGRNGQTLSVVRVTARHAVRHQIRCHLAYRGFPLVGDRLYGAQTALCDHAQLLVQAKLDREVLESGFLLLARELSFTHPMSGEQMRITTDTAWLKVLTERR